MLSQIVPVLGSLDDTTALALAAVAVVMVLAYTYAARAAASAGATKWYPEVPIVTPDSALGQDIKANLQWGMIRAHEKLGGIFQAIGDEGVPVVYLGSAAAVKDYFTNKALAKNAKTWADNDTHGVIDIKNLVQPFLTRTLFDLDGDDWKALRRTIAPFLASTDIIPTSLKYAQRVVDTWGDDDVECDFMEVVHETFQRLCCEWLSGGVPLDDDEGSEVYRTAIHHFIKRANKTTPEGLTAEDVAEFKKLLPHAHKVVGRVREAYNNNDNTRLSDKSLLWLMIASGNYDDEELANTFINLIVAGAESPAVSAGKTFARLLMEPEVLARCTDEVAAALVKPRTDLNNCWDDETPEEEGSEAPSRPILPADLDEMPYLEAVIMEGLRIYAPAALISRRCVAPTRILGKAVQPGAMVQVNVNAVHMDAAAWPEPGTFDAGRFMGKYNAAAFIPFGGGARVCPGKRATIIMCKGIYATILRRYVGRYNGTTADLDATVPNCYSAWAPNGVPVTLQRRENEIDEVMYESDNSVEESIAKRLIDSAALPSTMGARRRVQAYQAQVSRFKKGGNL